MYEFLKSSYYDEVHGEERIVLDDPPQLYRVTRTKVGIPETNRFTATGSGSTSWIPIDEAGNPVTVKRWHDPRYVETTISFLQENFVLSASMIRKYRDEAYPGAALAELREHLKELHPDLQKIDEMYQEGELDRLEKPLEQRLIDIEERHGLGEGAMRRDRLTLPKQYEDLKRQMRAMRPVMESYNIEVPEAARWEHEER